MLDKVEKNGDLQLPRLVGSLSPLGLRAVPMSTQTTTWKKLKIL